MNSKQFYTFQTRQGHGGTKFVNINNIACIEDLNPGCRITLNVRNDKGDFINFIAELPWAHVVGQITHLDNNQNGE